MGAGTPSTDGEAHPENGGLRLRPLLVGAAWMLGLGMLVRVGHYVASNPMTATVLGAVAVSFVVAPAGIPFAPSGPRARRRVAAGLLLGLAAAAVAVVAQLVGGGDLAFVGVGGALLFGTMEGLAIAFRDEVWLRGIPLVFARRAGVGRVAAAGFTVVASVAAVALEPSATPLGLLAIGAGAAASATLWLQGRDGWAPVAFRFGWGWAADALLAGDLMVLTGPSRLTSGPGLDGGLAVLVVIAFAVTAVAAVRVPLPPHPATDEELADDEDGP